MTKYKIIFSIILSASILLLIFHKINPAEVYHSFLASNLLLMFAALIIFLFSPLLLSLRWKKLLTLFGVKIKFLGVLKLYLASLPISKISPSNSGDLVRSYYTKKNIPIAGGAGIVIFENFIDIAVLSCFAIVGGVILNNVSALIAGLIFLLFFSFFYALGPKINSRLHCRWRDKINDFFNIANKIFNSKKVLLITILYGCMAWSAIFIFIYISFAAFGENVGLGQVLINQPVVILLGLLPITISGVGVRESTMLFLYAGQASSSSILSVGLIHSFLALCVLPIIGLPFLLKIIKHKDLYAR